MTAQLARIVVDFTEERTQSSVRDWDLSGSQANDLASARTSDPAGMRRTWPLAWRALLVVGTSAGLWLLVLVPLSVAGVLQLLP
jgi:hypothetical protein